MAAWLTAAGAKAAITMAAPAWARPGFWAALLVVLLLHAALTRGLAERLVPARPEVDAIARFDVRYVRDMALETARMQAPAAPSPSLATPAPRASLRAPPSAQSASARASEPASPPASAPDPTTLTELGEAEPPQSPAPAVIERRIVLPSMQPVPPTFALDAAPTEPAARGSEAPAEAGRAVRDDVAASAAAGEVPAAEAAAPPFEWPVSTRIAYKLTGHVRGEVTGQAQVEWIRVANVYQVHLDVSIGLSFAPMMTRRLSSEGELGVEGLVPRRFEQETKVGIGEPRRATIAFEPGGVRLSDGTLRATPAGVQDSVSQFIQLAYLFATQPERLRVGGAIDLPLALPRRVSRWTYEVLGEEPVQTAFGPIDTVRLRPRRDAGWGGDLAAEIWFAPQLRHLPARIVIRQDADTFLDLVLARRPQLAAR